MCMSIVASAFQYGWAPTLMPGDHDVDLAAVLGELDDPLERGGHPVHVLGARAHRDPRAGRQREPLQRHPHPLGQVERGDHPAALRLRQRAQRLRRVAEQHHPGDALGVPLGRRGDHAGDDRRACCCPFGRSTGTSAPVSSRSYSTKCRPAGEQAGQLVRVRRCRAGRAQHLLPVVVQRLRSARSAARRRAAARRRPASKVIRTAISVSSPVRRSRWRAMNRTSSSPAPAVVGSTRWAIVVQLLAGQLARRPDVDHDPVGVEPLLRRPLRLDVADRVEARGDARPRPRQRDQPAVGLAQRRSGRGPGAIATSRSSAGLSGRRTGTGRPPRPPTAAGSGRTCAAAAAAGAARSTGAGRGSAGPRPCRSPTAGT